MIHGIKPTDHQLSSDLSAIDDHCLLHYPTLLERLFGIHFSPECCANDCITHPAVLYPLISDKDHEHKGDKRDSSIDTQTNG